MVTEADGCEACGHDMRRHRPGRECPSACSICNKLGERESCNHHEPVLTPGEAALAALNRLAVAEDEGRTATPCLYGRDPDDCSACQEAKSVHEGRSTTPYRENDAGQQVWPCARVEPHDAHVWTWRGRFVVADHECPGLTAPARTTTAPPSARGT